MQNVLLLTVDVGFLIIKTDTLICMVIMTTKDERPVSGVLTGPCAPGSQISTPLVIDRSSSISCDASWGDCSCVESLEIQYNTTGVAQLF